MKKDNENVLELYSNRSTLLEKIRELGEKYLAEYLTLQPDELSNSEYAALKTKLSQMRQAGLDKTKNYLVLETKLKDYEKNHEEEKIREKAKEALSLLSVNIGQVHSGLGFIILGESDFAKILQERGYRVDVIDEFSGELTEEEVDISIDLYNNITSNSICQIPDLDLNSPKPGCTLVKCIEVGFKNILCRNNKNELESTPLFRTNGVEVIPCENWTDVSRKLLIASADNGPNLLFHLSQYGVIIYVLGGGIDYGSI